jgi:hypothetical protein
MSAIVEQVANNALFKRPVTDRHDRTSSDKFISDVTFEGAGEGVGKINWRFVQKLFKFIFLIISNIFF